jgi:DNA-binding XRE family transcriptional regulator
MIDAANAAFKDLVNVPYPDPDLPPFCQFFMNVRLAHNLSIEGFSKMLGISKKRALNIEKGQIWGNVTPQMIIKIENIFNLRRGCVRNYLKQSCLIQ